MVAGRADERKILRDARVRVRQGLAEGEVDGVGGHDPVGRELAAGDRGEARHDAADRVLAGDLGRGGLGARSEPGLQQRAQARVDADDVLAADRLGEHLVGVVEHVVDVGRRGDRLGDVARPRGVGGADDPVAGPWDDEQHRLLGAQEDAGLGVDGLPRQDEVDALRGEHLEAAVRRGEILRALGPHAGGVDRPGGADGVLGAGGEVDDPGADDMAAVVLEVTRDPGAARRRGAVRDGRADQVDDQARVVDAGVVEADGAGQAAGVEGGGQGRGALAGQVVLERDGPAPVGAGEGQRVVHADADRRVGAFVLVLEGPQEGLGLDEVRRGAGEQSASFGERLVHEGEVELVEVAQAAVDELGRPARGAAGPVAHLDDAGAQAARRGVQGDAGARHPAADDEDVEALRRAQLLEGSGAPVGGQCRVAT